MSDRLLLSPPHLAGEEAKVVLDALESGWIAPAGPHLDAFEAEVADLAGRRHGVALSSGTAALHLALLALGVGRDDQVLVPTLTFAATANAVCHAGATPVFIDVDPDSWNLDVGLVEAELALRARLGHRMPAAIVTVDLYGRVADHTRLAPIAERYGVPVIEDAAEALGATHAGRPAGSFGTASVFSFNGNKIITTSGGGMLVTDDTRIADRVRHLSTQAREPARHYEHRDVGFNHRLSNVLAALGRAQLPSLDERVARRRAINARYRERLSHVDAVGFPPVDPDGVETHWLTCLTIDQRHTDATRDSVIDALEAADVESRPVWKPMHLQPVFRDHPVVGGQTAQRLFDTGLCLPSGSQMQDADVDRVASIVEAAVESPPPIPPARIEAVATGGRP